MPPIRSQWQSEARGFDLAVKCVIVCAVFQSEGAFDFFGEIDQESVRFFRCLSFRIGAFFTKYHAL